MGSGEKFDFLAQLEAHARASQELGDKRAEENAKKLKDSRSQNYDDIPTLESDDDIGAPGARGGGSDSGDGKDGEGSGEEEVKRKSKAWLTRKVDGVADKIESWYRFLTCKRSPVAPIEFVPNSKPGQGPEILRLENFLDLNSEDVDRLYGYFCAIDGDGSGEISIDEFCEYFNMPQTEFTERAFAVLDEDNSGAIDFKEFVVVLLSYCSFDFTSLSKFAFYLYDVDKSLMLDREEVQEMVAHVYDVPPDMIEPRILRVIELFDDDGDEKINIYEFVTHAKQYPMLLYPAYVLQQKLRRDVCGERWWRETIDARAASFQGGDIRKLFAEFQLSEDIKAVEKKKEERAKKNHITPENHPLRKLRTVNTIEPGRNRRPKYRERG